MELSDDEQQALVYTLLSPLQAYGEPNSLQTMQLCLHHFLLTIRALYQRHLPMLRRFGSVHEGWRFISTSERVAIRYQCWQCLREIEVLCARLLPWGHLISATLTTMLEQLEHLPEQDARLASQSRSTPSGREHQGADSVFNDTRYMSAGHDLASFFKPDLEIYKREPAFRALLEWSGLEPRILRMLDGGFVSLLHYVLSLLEIALPTMATRINRSKQQQAMALLNLQQGSDLLLKQAAALLQGLSELRAQESSTSEDPGPHMRRS